MRTAERAPADRLKARPRTKKLADRALVQAAGRRRPALLAAGVSELLS